MGQALYRKYRSKSLSEIVGQEHITDTLGIAIKTGRISHAYLFTGPKGVGKTSIARILAHEINGLPYDEQQSHIDIIEIDAASNRRIDEIRELRDKIHVAPALAKYKVYVIDEVHMLTREAFNALLKTLEEPPAHAVFILATTEAHKLPETIISRTQRYVFRPIEPAKAVKHLRSIADTEKLDITDDALALVVEHGNGSFRDSISLLDQLGNTGSQIDLSSVQEVLGIAPVQAIDELLNTIRTGESANTAYTLLTTLFHQGYQPASVAKQLAAALRNGLILSKGASTRDIALLSALLETPLSHDPEAALEIALLNYSAVAEPQTAKSVPIAHVDAPPVSEAKPHTQETVKIKPATQVSTKPKSTPPTAEPAPEPIEQSTHAESLARTSTGTVTMNPESWQNVLDLLKKQHNTLYGIVRMAQPDFSIPGALHLSFGFAFHQKRANEAKNRTVIADAVAKVIGEHMEITCTYDSDAKTAQPVLAVIPATSVDDTSGGAPLSTISNIFGGAEMVE